MKIPPFKLDRWLNDYQFSANPPEFDFASSTGPHWKLSELLRLVSADEHAGLLETELVYSDAAGRHSLRTAIAEMYGVSPEHVQVVTGTSEALLVVFAAASEPGANVVLPSPLFPSTTVIPDLMGLEQRFYQIRRENNFVIDVEEVKNLVDDCTTVILVNSPHNPTGAILADDELRELHDFAVERGIQFVADEVYHPIYYGEETASAATLPRATVLGSCSKALSLSGVRTGWIIERNLPRLHQYLEARGYFTISNPPLAERFAEIAIRNRDQILARTREVARANLKLLDAFFAHHEDQLGWIRPRGGLTAFPWLNDGTDSRKFCQELAERGVLFAPGDCFEMPNHFRIGFGVAAERFGEGLSRVSDYLQSRKSAMSAA